MAAEFLGQISRQTQQDFFRRIQPCFSPGLHKLHDAPTDFPICGSEDGIDMAGGLTARFFKQRGNPARPGVVARTSRTLAGADNGGTFSFGWFGAHGTQAAGATVLFLSAATILSKIHLPSFPQRSNSQWRSGWMFDFSISEIRINFFRRETSKSKTPQRTGRCGAGWQSLL